MRYLRLIGPAVSGGVLRLNPSGRSCSAVPAEEGGSMELRCDGTHIQYRTNGGAWDNIVAVGDLRGPAGEVGEPGPAGERGFIGVGIDGREVELQATATHVQWRYVGGSWANLVALSAITGPAGAAGTPGAAGVAGAPGIQGPAGATGATGAQGVQGVKGDKGDKGDTGNTGAQGTQGIQGIQGTAGSAGATGAAGTNGTNGTNGLGYAARAIKTSADQVLIGSTFATVTGLDMAVAANTNYMFEYWILADVDATTTGVDVAVSGPANPTQIAYECEVYTSATATAKTSATAYDANSANANSAGAAQRWYKVKGVLRNGANAGNLSARIKREAVGTGPNVRAGSFGLLTLLS